MKTDLFEEVKGIISGIPLKTGDKVVCIPCIINEYGYYASITEPLVCNLYYEGCCNMSNPSGNGYELFNLLHPDNLIKYSHYDVVELGSSYQGRSIKYLVEDYDLYFGITDLWETLTEPTELPIEVIEKFIKDTGVNKLAQHNNGSIYISPNLKNIINWNYKNYTVKNIAQYFKYIFTNSSYFNTGLLYIEASEGGIIKDWGKYLPDLIRFKNFRDIIDHLGLYEKNPNGFLSGDRIVYKKLLEFIYSTTLSKI